MHKTVAQKVILLKIMIKCVMLTQVIVWPDLGGIRQVPIRAPQTKQCHRYPCEWNKPPMSFCHHFSNVRLKKPDWSVHLLMCPIKILVTKQLHLSQHWLGPIHKIIFVLQNKNHLFYCLFLQVVCV